MPDRRRTRPLPPWRERARAPALDGRPPRDGASPPHPFDQRFRTPASRAFRPTSSPPLACSRKHARLLRPGAWETIVGLGAVAGQYVTFTLTSTEDLAAPTYFLLDDTALTLHP
ncbi:hypothetical protein [Streptomyces sp. NPDC056361]|uniref:hypothetical protein n=1 Tax=Streptomyces sp. NPDC056361 TaxID=3345795 RepID=UPI0035DB901D